MLIHVYKTYASGTLNSSQRNWPAWKREMYGSLRAIQKWNHYLLGDHFTLVTDHQANVYMMDPSRNHPAIINNWIILLSSYKYTVVHRPGKTLFLEDALSRSPNLLSLSTSSPIDINTIISNQKNDPILKVIIHSLTHSIILLSNYFLFGQTYHLFNLH